MWANPMLKSTLRATTRAPLRNGTRAMALKSGTWMNKEMGYDT